jgi:5-methyltetrahydropteroyltriglutamate--homocysteine methyltransferase
MSTERILTTHVGSLIRPDSLLPALRAIERGESYDVDAYQRQLSAAVRDVVRRQADIGVDVVDDGETGKISWITYIYNRVTGIEPRIVPMEEGAALSTLPADLDRSKFTSDEDILSEVWRFAGFWAEDYQAAGEGTEWVCTGPIRYDPSSLAIDLANLRAAVTDVDVVGAFVPAVAPGSIYWIRNEYYASEEEFLFAIADALHEEYRAIVDAGFYLHVDDAVMWHKSATIALAGGTPDDYHRWARLRVDALNHALEGIPQDRVRYHICSASGHGPHVHDPNLIDVLEHVLTVNAGTYLIEQANARHEHEWRVWEDIELPEGKILAPGVVTHHTEMVEHPELVAERLVRIAKLVGRDRVMAGTDCGFAQASTTRRVPVWTQWAKLEALVEGARLASRQLWGANAA